MHKPNLHAINFSRLHCYNTEWKLNKIIFFEYLLYCHKRFGDNFFHSTSDFVERTLVSKNTILNLINEFEELGYLKVERNQTRIKGYDFRNRYSLNFDHILKSFRQIYDLGDEEEKDIQENEEILKEWYRFLRDNPYDKTKSSKTDYDVTLKNTSLVMDDDQKQG